MPKGTCYVHDGLAPVKRIFGNLCYDKDTAPPQDPPLFCSFDL